MRISSQSEAVIKRSRKLYSGIYYGKTAKYCGGKNLESRYHHIKEVLLFFHLFKGYILLWSEGAVVNCKKLQVLKVPLWKPIYFVSKQLVLIQSKSNVALIYTFGLIWASKCVHWQENMDKNLKIHTVSCDKQVRNVVTSQKSEDSGSFRKRILEMSTSWLHWRGAGCLSGSTMVAWWCSYPYWTPRKYI